MNELNSSVDQGHPETPRGMRVVAGGERWQVLDDEVNGLAIVNIENGQGKRLEIDTIKVPRPETKLGWKIIEYVADACKGRVGLVEFVLRNRSTMNLAEYLYRYKSKSKKSMAYYAYQVRDFCDSLLIGRTPDGIVTRCFDGEGLVDRKEVRNLSILVKQYMGEFEAEGDKQGTLGVYQARIVSFFKVNGIALDQLVPYDMVADNPGRALTQEELQRMLDVADLRGRAMIATQAVTGVREETLLALRYGHVREDLEARRFPTHIHLEGEILKGHHVSCCDTFITEEVAVRYLIPYIDDRKRGTKKIGGKIPTENITDESYLFVVPVVDPATRTLTTKPLAYNTFWGMMHKIFIKANLTARKGRTYNHRPHCLRWFFRTQMGALGMRPDLIEFMMGHKLPTYDDEARNGVESMRGEYAKANLRIQPQPQGASLKDLLEAIIRAQREDPRNYLKEGIGPAMDVITPEAMTDLYAREIWGLLKNEIAADVASIISTPDERLAY